MGLGQVHDVDVVAHAGAVRGVVVWRRRSGRLPALEAVENHGDEVYDGVVGQVGPATGNVEVAQVKRRTKIEPRPLKSLSRGGAYPGNTQLS